MKRYCKNIMSVARGHRLLTTGILCLFALFSVLAVCANVKPRPKSDKKVEMIHTDVLSYDVNKNRDAQILTGHVKFLHEKVYMFCDSAHFYRASNSFEAFGHVRMIQGDTLSLTGDYLYYDGNEQIAQVRRHVIMKHRKSILKTDSLNYDRLYSLGYLLGS